MPTKIKWKPNSNRKVCYQFDGKSKNEKRFPSKEVENEVLDSIKDRGYEIIRLGSGMTLEECVIAASECEIFIGIDSGMCYLAAAVGVPTFFCKNNRPSRLWEDTNHSNKHFILAKDYIELIDHLSKYATNGLDYYIENATNINLFKQQLES